MFIDVLRPTKSYVRLCRTLYSGLVIENYCLDLKIVYNICHKKCLCLKRFFLCESHCYLIRIYLVISYEVKQKIILFQCIYLHPHKTFLFVQNSMRAQKFLINHCVQKPWIEHTVGPKNRVARIRIRCLTGSRVLDSIVKWLLI